MEAYPLSEEEPKGTVEDVSVVSECYCPNCKQASAIHTILPTNIPFFREVVVVSVCCPRCNYQSSEATVAGELQKRGERFCLQVTEPRDLNRQIVKSNSARLMIPQLELEIPPNTQRGTVSTLEGVLKRAACNLEASQPERLKLGDLDNFYRCKNVIDRLRILTAWNEEEERERFPFDIILDDPAGNSFIENPNAPQQDPNLISEKYDRTPSQNKEVGIRPSPPTAAADAILIQDDSLERVSKLADTFNRSESNLEDDETDGNLLRREVVSMPVGCPNCQQSAETSLCQIEIPHFKQVLLMTMFCEQCGYRSTEVKPAGGIPKHGTKTTLQIQTEEDLKRELLVSDAAVICIPQVELEQVRGMEQGVYTTVEGLIQRLAQRLTLANPFATGDAAEKHHLTNDGQEFSETTLHAKYRTFLANLRGIGEGSLLPATLIVDDPLSHSFIGPLPMDATALREQAGKEGSSDCYKQYIDPGVTVDAYERTAQQNEALGLTDIKTENYWDGQSIDYGTDKLEAVEERACWHSSGPDRPEKRAVQSNGAAT